MNITIEKNQASVASYEATIDATQETIHSPAVFQVPVFSGNSSGYFTDLCGFRATGKSIDMLNGRIHELMEGLVQMSRLPRHVFIARRAKKVYPIYTIGDEVVTSTPGGPIFSHVELAKTREYLTDYLHEIDVLGENGVSDKLHVRGVSLYDLQLRRPVFYLKKRIANEPEFWAPVFENHDKDGLYTYAASDRREVKLEYGGNGLLILTRIVAEALITEKRLNNIYDLRPDRLQPEYWEKLKEKMWPVESIKIGSKEIEIFQSDDTLIGMEYREKEERFGLFLDESKDQLIERIKSDFRRRNI